MDEMQARREARAFYRFDPSPIILLAVGTAGEAEADHYSSRVIGTLHCGERVWRGTSARACPVCDGALMAGSVEDRCVLFCKRARGVLLDPIGHRRSLPMYGHC